MIKINDKTKCSGCHACASICPKSCITMERDEEGFLYPTVNVSLCVECGLCERACPIIEKNKTEDSTLAYAVKNTNDGIRMQSSSGGVFTAVASEVISNGGVVFGAAFDDDFNVKHICVENTEDLSNLRGSKYVQSEIGNAYKKAKENLDAKKRVFFTGTPCQIEGLLKYLKKDYQTLITADIICHGVPSPLVWQMYLKTKSQDNPTSVSFRDKKYGWGRYAVRINFESGEEYFSLASEDKYIKAFLSDLCLRPSCYNCSFKSKNRASDLTLADFWGIKNVLPEMNDGKGTSLLLVHSKKGEEIFQRISKQVTCQKVDLDTALTYNKSAIKSVDKPKNRDVFMAEIGSESFDETVQKYTKTTFVQRVKGKIKRIIRKLFN